MSYGINLSHQAKDKLALLPIPVRRLALKQLALLGEHPTALSVRSHFPCREKCQLYQFDVDAELERWELCALFQYAQDEVAIEILTIGVSRREPWEGMPPDDKDDGSEK